VIDNTSISRTNNDAAPFSQSRLRRFIFLFENTLREQQSTRIRYNVISRSGFRYCRYCCCCCCDIAQQLSWKMPHYLCDSLFQTLVFILSCACLNSNNLLWLNVSIESSNLVRPYVYAVPSYIQHRYVCMSKFGTTCTHK
jgi:hypothetical protein